MAEYFPYNRDTLSSRLFPPYGVVFGATLVSLSPSLTLRARKKICASCWFAVP
jgi:hypothetical protein